MTVPPERREMIPASVFVVYGEMTRPSVAWAPTFYLSFIPDIFIPPPETSC